MGNETYDVVGKTNTKEECAERARRKYPNATGASWIENTGRCYVEFGTIRYWGESQDVGYFACLFHGKSYCIYLYIHDAKISYIEQC